jgi:hypothetical protein
MLVEVFLEGLGMESSWKRKGVEAGNEIEKLSHHTNLEKKSHWLGMLNVYLFVKIPMIILLR